MSHPQERRVRYQNGTLERMARKIGPDIWTFRWAERASGRRRRVRLGTVKELHTMQAVKQAADGYRLSANCEGDAPRQVTMSSVLERYEREVVTPYVTVPLGGIDDGKISTLTAKSYRSYLRRWICPRWSKYLITDLAKPQLRSTMEAWLAELSDSGRLAPKTVRSVGSLMRLIFRRAVKWGYLESNPMDFVDLPEGSTRRKEKPRTLSPAEYLKLLKLFEPRERLAIEIAGWLGTRRSEGFGLKWQDIDLKTGVVTFRQGFVSGRISQLKTEASRAEMSIPAEVRNSLTAWKKQTLYRSPGDWVFASPATNGNRPFWPDSMLVKHIRPIAQAAGFGKIGWHTFRHSLSAWGKEALKLEETKELLRHSNVQTTSDIYGGLSLEAKRAAQGRLVKFVHRVSRGERKSTANSD
jgi:integrase